MPLPRLKILIAECDGFSTQAAERLHGVSDLVLADLDRESLISYVDDIDVLWVRLRHRIDEEILAKAIRLKFIVTATTGLNHIDLEEAARRGISVISLRGEVEFLQDIRATGEHTIALMLSLLRHIPNAFQHVRDGGWNRDLFRGSELYEKTVGVVGYGRLGRIVARYLKAFGARVVVSDPFVKADSIELADITLVSLSQLLAQSDIVTLHVNLSAENTKFFGSQQFAQMKRGACFINTSRGELIDENALVESLRSGWLAGAGLDVLDAETSEGMGNHSLVAYSRECGNLIITPHMGGCTSESMEKTESFLADRLVSLLSRG